MEVERDKAVAAGRARSLVGLAACLLALPLVLLPTACDPAGSETVARAYLPRTAHQAYGHALAQARLAQTALGREWLAAAQRALEAPEAVSLPHEASLAFDAAAPAAWGYRVDARAGQQMTASVRAEGTERSELFVDLFRADGARLAHVASAAPVAAEAAAGAVRNLEWRVLEAGAYVLRVQPELLRSGTVHVELRGGPLLAFPVSGVDSRAILSGFGAERDGGARAHRGVDIFAERGTDAVAALDAWVSRVDTTPRGGNVVWLQPLFGEMRLYYAHLDTQLVVPGQFVRSGEIVGTIGNTGNARTTPPHLHFGVYLRRRGMRGGATDPVHFLR